jgi:hypothetical protein
VPECARNPCDFSKAYALEKSSQTRWRAGSHSNPRWLFGKVQCAGGQQSAHFRRHIASWRPPGWRATRPAYDFQPGGLRAGSPPSPPPHSIRPIVRRLLRSPRLRVRVPTDACVRVRRPSPAVQSAAPIQSGCLCDVAPGSREPGCWRECGRNIPSPEPGRDGPGRTILRSSGNPDPA